LRGNLIEKVEEVEHLRRRDDPILGSFRRTTTKKTLWNELAHSCQTGGSKTTSTVAKFAPKNSR
jgi:hypothetical protein